METNMEVLITGGAGFLGSKLARQLLARGTLAGPSGQAEKISRITLLDQVAAQGFDDSRITIMTGDAADAAVVAKALTPSVQSVFHLAAVVSGEAESDFDLGMRINLDATRILLEQARKNGNRPRLVFTSSVAVFGGDLPPKVLDTTPATPQGSYGAQKAMCELMVTDYSRKGFVDGRSLRLPTVTVRPGKANKAASSFASGIIREPLNGVVSECPVPPDTKVWALSPRSTVHNLIHAHELDSAAFGSAGAVNLPGLTTTVGEMVAAMGRVAGADTMKLVEWKEDPAIMKLVRTWPGDFVTTRAEKMGFVHDASFDDVVKAYMEEELG
jgi:nucleoside-diphosphate-sugar epimerase